MDKKCIKVKFAKEQDALFQLAKINKTSKRVKKPTRVYKCYCGSWHLTSRLDVKDIQQENEKLIKINESLIKQINELSNKENSKLKLKVRINETVSNQRKQIKLLQDYIKKLRHEISDLQAKLYSRKNNE